MTSNVETYGSIDDRVADLLGRMSLDEKVAQLGCVWLVELVSGDAIDRERAATLFRNGMGQVTRIGASTGLEPARSAAVMNELQRLCMDSGRHGIPLLVHEESVGGYCARGATVFPQALALACSWDTAMIGEIADVIRQQMLSVGARLTLAPVLDVARDPRWGRVEETYGEDPVLCGSLGTAYVKAIQRDLTDGVAATAKHFVGYSMPYGGRNWGAVHLGPRELREVYAEPFAAAIRDAGIAAVMNSYSSVDGEPCAGSRAVLTGLLRDELGFDGVVVADYFAVALLESHHRTAATKGQAAAQALLAGLDAELPAHDCFSDVPGEVAAGRLSMEVVDEAVRRVLRLKFSLGLFERPYVDADKAAAVFDTAPQRALARRAAAAGVVVLTNDGVLPLDLARDATIALIGPAADDGRLLQGDYHYPAHIEITLPAETEEMSPSGPLAEAVELQPNLLPEAGGAFQIGRHFTPHVTPLDALRALVGDIPILHERGCSISDHDRSGFAAAVEAASAADVAVVMVGGRSGLTTDATVGEGRDAVDLSLPGVQEELVHAVLDTGTPTVVVVLSGRVHTLQGIAERANALVVTFPLGEEGGNGIFDVLTGAVAPRGRLPVTLPRHVGQIPIFHAQRAGGATAMFHGAYVDAPVTPLFPFGHGLGYTTFAYDNLTVEATDTTSPVKVSVRVTNTGDRDGTEVVQLYGSDLVASVARPDKELLGFGISELAAGTSAAVDFTVDPSRLAFYDAAMGFVIEPGAHRFSVGASSADIRAEAVVELTGPTKAYEQRAVVATRVSVH